MILRLRFARLSPLLSKGMSNSKALGIFFCNTHFHGVHRGQVDACQLVAGTRDQFQPVASFFIIGRTILTLQNQQQRA